jgi:hypothetical protein
MFASVLMISASELASMMDDEELVEELEECVETTCAFPVRIDNRLYDADDMAYDARISRWMTENCGLNKTTIYVEVEA